MLIGLLINITMLFWLFKMVGISINLIFVIGASYIVIVNTSCETL